MKAELPKRGKGGKFVKGGGSYWTGKTFSDEYRKKLSDAHIGVQAEEKHPHWKGDDVSYGALHAWVARHLGKPSLCAHCGTTEAKKFEWANVSGDYLRSLDDWIRLCTRCHHKYDNIYEKVWEIRRSND